MSAIPISFIFCLILTLNLVVALNNTATKEEKDEDRAWGSAGSLVMKNQRKIIASTEYGSISAVNFSERTGSGIGRSYHLQFISMDPNSLFLPVLLHADMIFYVHTGSGKLSWTEKDQLSQINLEMGDVNRLRSGTIFYIQSSLEPERERLRIDAIFANPDEDLQESAHGAYSSINDMIRGFDKRVLKAAFKVPEELIEEITSETQRPQIVHANQQKKDTIWDKEVRFIKSILQLSDPQNKKKKLKTFNFYKEDPDFENCNGWSTVVTKSELQALHGTHIGVHMVNLTKGSMMGPHWNPSATEISIVLHGEGMVRVVCPSSLTEIECNNTRFRIKEGDVFSVPRYHPMTQISFNNDSLVFMGFTTTSKKNHPQFLAGKASVLHALDKDVLETSFDVNTTAIDQLLAAQAESIILECTSCAEEEERLMEEEIENARQEEEQRRREEEEARKREKEEEEARKREEEEQRKREEEEARKREEEEQKRREDEQKKRKEEKEQRRRQEEEEQRREEEEEERRRHEEQERQEKEDRRRQEEEKQRREEWRRQQEEEQRRKERRRQREEEQRRQEEERTRHEERRRQEEEERGRQEEQPREETEEQQARREEEERIERQRHQEAASRRRQEEGRGRQPQGQPREETEEEQARRAEEERTQREIAEEAASRRRREREGRERRGHRQQEEEQPRQETEEEQAAREEEERIQREIEAAAASRRGREYQPPPREPGLTSNFVSGNAI